MQAWPWSTLKWQEYVRALEQPINSIMDLDARISSILIGHSKPRQIDHTFERYYGEIAHPIPVERVLHDIIPSMVNLVKNAPSVMGELVTLPAGTAHTCCFTRRQVATLMACIWFGAFGVDRVENFSECSFTGIFNNANVFALACLLDYFDMVCSDYHTHKFDGRVLIKRNVMKRKPKWDVLHKPLTHTAIGEGGIDGSPSPMLAVFTQKFILHTNFNGVLTQEETMVLLRPESYITTMVCERLNDHESVCFIGAKMVSQYRGFGSSTTYNGKFVDCSDVVGVGNTATIKSGLVFMDASNRHQRNDQFVDDFVRDLNKATCAFSSYSCSTVASGNWNHFNTGNNIYVKFIQQLLAASACGKELIYHPHGADFEQEVVGFIAWCAQNISTCSQLYNAYVAAIEKIYKGPTHTIPVVNMFSEIMETAIKH